MDSETKRTSGCEIRQRYIRKLATIGSTESAPRLERTSELGWRRRCCSIPSLDWSATESSESSEAAAPAPALLLDQ